MSCLKVSTLQLKDGAVIAPQTLEVAQMLAGQGVAALRLEQPITVSPCFVIRSRFRQLPMAAERVLGRVLERL